MVLTTEEKVFIVEHYFWSYGVGRQNGLSLHHVREHYKEQFNKRAPSNKIILAIVKNFHCTGLVLCQQKETTGHPRTITTNKNHERLLQQVLQSPKHSLRWTSLKLVVSDRSVRGMFKEVGRFAYRIQGAQYLTETDEQARLQYCSRVLSMTYADTDFFSNIWFLNESHIHLNGYINRETTRFLGFEWPDVVIQKPLHSAWVTILCTISGHRILGPYFVEVDAQNLLTVNQERYREIIIAPFVWDLKHFCCTRNLQLHASRCSYSQHSRKVTCLSCNNTLVIA